MTAKRTAPSHYSDRANRPSTTVKQKCSPNQCCSDFVNKLPHFLLTRGVINFRSTTDWRFSQWLEKRTDQFQSLSSVQQEL